MIATAEPPGELWNGSREHMEKWLTQFCEGALGDRPQHVFWEILNYLRSSVPKEVADEQHEWLGHMLGTSEPYVEWERANEAYKKYESLSKEAESSGRE